MSREPEDQLEGTQIRRQAKFTKLVEADRLALRTTMSTKEGRRVVWRILKSTGWDEPSFTGNSETFRREGMRIIGLTLRSELKTVCRDLYLQMVNENEKEASNG